MTSPTARQLELHQFMILYQHEHSMPPTLREICEAFGWSSTNSAKEHLRYLEQKGLVKHVKGKKCGLARGYVAIQEGAVT